MNPDFPMPPRACDCHVHVFGAPERYPAAPTRQYTPSEMGLEHYGALTAALGLERLVLVQPSAYGTDNRCLLDAMAARSETTRGVVVIDPAIAGAELRALHAQGVRGVRLNLMNPRIGDAAAAKVLMQPIAARIASLGWHVQVYADTSVIAPIAEVIGNLPVPVVLDHMAGAKQERGVGDPHFRTVLDLLAAGGCWVKLSGADIVTTRDTGFEAAAEPFARALVRANPSQVVWGTDWPHPFHFHGAMGDGAPAARYRRVDERGALDLLRHAVPDEDTWQRILVDNPERLYGF
jgi:2-pyrone-4,6-dicarboxylate lactonase